VKLSDGSPRQREHLARGLFNTLNHAKAEDDLARRDTLLNEVRTLAHAYPDDAAVRARLARGLFSTLNQFPTSTTIPCRCSPPRPIR
jgi:hypothetical protein